MDITLRLGRAKSRHESLTAKLQMPWVLSDIHRFRDPRLKISRWGQETHERRPALVAADCVVYFRAFILDYV